ncbi:MAG TPA: LysE family transporter [Methanothrix sp.]|nr:LysE family transporter [Methanothrix sp.]
MDLTFLQSGLLIGMSIAAPIGPIGLLCIRRTLAEGRLSGIVSGLGAATADAIFGCIAAFGLTVISGILIDQQIWLRLAGGLLLSYLGIRIIRDNPGKQMALAGGNCLIASYVSALFLTLTNPMTIFSFAAFFASWDLASEPASSMSAWALVSGVFIGSSLWWLILSITVGAFQEKIDEQGLTWVNRVSGAVITGFGLFAILR